MHLTAFISSDMVIMTKLEILGILFTLRAKLARFMMCYNFLRFVVKKTQFVLLNLFRNWLALSFENKFLFGGEGGNGEVG